MQIRWKYERVSRLLTPAVKTKVRQVIPLYLPRVAGQRSPHAIYQSALTSLRFKFPQASPVQMDHLAFYLLGLAATLDGDIKGRSGSMNEMSDMTSMRLQMAMDRRSKFVEALANIMTKIDSTQETIVQNMKG